MQEPIICWFRHDLRLHDNLSLHAALQTDNKIICLYILDKDVSKKWPVGSASQWWLHHSLKNLGQSLKEIGGRLILRQGNTLDELSKLIQKTQASGLYFSRLYDPDQIKLEKQINNQFKDQLQIRRFKGYLLCEPEDIKTGKNEPYT